MRSDKKFLFIFLFSVFFFFLSFFFVQADTLGQVSDFFISPEYDYAGRSRIRATLRLVSEKAYWYVSDTYWDTVSKSDQDEFLQKLADVAKEFDQHIYPSETAFWGSEWNPGIDQDPRITIVISRLRDEVGGYFDTANEYPRERVVTSNERELLFLSAFSLLSGQARAFLAHELQHLISFYQKTIVRNVNEEIWLNELRSEYSVRKLGYDRTRDDSNIRRRISAFLADPSDPLAEWRNQASDYGAVTLFGAYLVDRFGDAILVDSLRSPLYGIASIEAALRRHGFRETFQEIFTDWTITNFVNDQNLDARYTYRFAPLTSLRIMPTSTTFVYGNGSIEKHGTIKDWQALWYTFRFVDGAPSKLQISFKGTPDSQYAIPVVIDRLSGEREIRFVPLQGTSGSAQLDGANISSLTIIVSAQGKRDGFSDNDPRYSFSLALAPLSSSVLLPELVANIGSSRSSSGLGVDVLKEGSLLRFNGVLYVVKDKWVRALSDQAVGQYGHLVHLQPITVDVATFYRYTVSNYIRPENSSKVYAVWSDGTKHWLKMSGEQFIRSGRSFEAVYVVNEAEANLYREGDPITE